MNALAIAIQTEQLNGTVAEVHASLLADVVVSTDATTYSLSGAVDRLFTLGVSPSVLLDARLHIRTLPIGGDTLEGMLLTAGGESGGVDFSREPVRLQLQANQAHQTTTAEQQAILAGMLAIGVKHGPRWQRHLNSEPSESDVQFSLNQLACETLLESIRSTIGPSAVNSGKTVAELKSLIAEA